MTALSPQAMFGYNLTQITSYISSIQPNTASICPNGQDKSNLDKAIARILELLATKMIYNAKLPQLYLTYDGETLPTETLYDFLGYVLSKVWAKDVPNTATPRNFYLPLLATYTKWCSLLGGSAESGKMMTHIAWIQTPTSPSVDILMAATLGGSMGTDARGKIVLRRQNSLHEAGLQPADEAQQSFQNTGEGDQGFARCAETFFWIYAAKRNLNLQTVRGFALSPNKDNRTAVEKFPTISSLTTYNERACAWALTDFCSQSCLPLFDQIKAKPRNGTGPAWYCRKSFDSQALACAIIPPSGGAPPPAPGLGTHLTNLAAATMTQMVAGTH